MKKNSGVIIAGLIGTVIIIIVGIYADQDSKVNEVPSGPEKYDTGDEIIDNKLKEIAKQANSNDFEPAPREWITSGPFQVDRLQYVMGEKVFIRIGELEPNEKGQIAFLKLTNKTHYTVYQTIPFDGSSKNAFNVYTDIKLSKTLGLCSVDDILGEWIVSFRGTEYSNIKFNIINQTLPGEEKMFSTPVC